MQRILIWLIWLSTTTCAPKIVIEWCSTVKSTSAKLESSKFHPSSKFITFRAISLKLQLKGECGKLFWPWTTITELQIYILDMTDFIMYAIPNENKIIPRSTKKKYNIYLYITQSIYTGWVMGFDPFTCEIVKLTALLYPKLIVIVSCCQLENLACKWVNPHGPWPNRYNKGKLPYSLSLSKGQAPATQEAGWTGWW